MMVTHTVGVLLLLLSLSSGVIVHDIHCDYIKNEYYLPQGDLCKKCDRCPPAFGIEPEEDMTVEIDPVHGAMGCRRCVHCPKGHFSKSRSYRECKICRNCSLEGRVELRKCTDTSNAKCGGSLPLSQYVTPKANKLKTETDSNIQSVEEFKSDNGTAPIIIVVGSITVMILLVLGMLYLLRTRQCGKRSVTGVTDSLSRNYQIETKPILQTDSFNTACEDVDVDGKTELHYVFHEWKIKNGSEVPLNSRHVLYLSKPLAPNNTFHSLGIKLGIPENEIAIIQTNYSGDIANQAYHTLEKWQRLMGESASVLKVLNCLIELKRYDIVEKFCKDFS